MAGETEEKVSAWTTDTALKFTQQQIDALHKELDDYKADIKLRFIEVNEFRGSLSDLGRNMATKVEVQALSKNIDDKFTEHSKQLVELRSRLDVGNPAIGTIQGQLAISQGRMQGSDKTIAYVITIISVLFGLVGIAIAILQ